MRTYIFYFFAPTDCNLKSMCLNKRHSFYQPNSSKQWSARHVNNMVGPTKIVWTQGPNLLTLRQCISIQLSANHNYILTQAKLYWTCIDGASIHFQYNCRPTTIILTKTKLYWNCIDGASIHFQYNCRPTTIILTQAKLYWNCIDGASIQCQLNCWSSIISLKMYWRVWPRRWRIPKSTKNLKNTMCF